MPSETDRFVKAIEDVWQVLRRDPHAGVRNAEQGDLRCLFRDQSDPAAGRRVPERIRRQVLQRLFEAPPVTPHFQFLVGQGHLDGHLILRAACSSRHHAIEQLRDGHGL